jgi:hypothetical protein
MTSCEEAFCKLLLLPLDATLGHLNDIPAPRGGLAQMLQDRKLASSEKSCCPSGVCFFYFRNGVNQ